MLAVAVSRLARIPALGTVFFVVVRLRLVVALGFAFAFARPRGGASFDTLPCTSPNHSEGWHFNVASLWPSNNGEVKVQAMFVHGNMHVSHASDDQVCEEGIFAKVLEGSRQQCVIGAAVKGEDNGPSGHK